MTQNEGQNFGSSSRALGAFDQRGPYGILIHLGVDFVKMNESQFRAENPAAKYPLPYWQKLLKKICLSFPLIDFFFIYFSEKQTKRPNSFYSFNLKHLLKGQSSSDTKIIFQIQRASFFVCSARTSTPEDCPCCQLYKHTF